MSKLKVLDLFSGIGGFSLGLERTGGFETAAFCEIDPFCQQVLAKHWPEVKQYHDVRELTAARLAADGIAVDVITGGFPCQDISNAGKRAGIEGSRSGLWGEIARLIGELRPRYLLMENVSSLLSGPSEQPGQWFSRVLGDLAALRYDAQWDCISAADIGLPQARDRVWLVAYPEGFHVEEPALVGSQVLYGQPRGTRPDEGGSCSSWQAHQPSLVGVVDGVPAKLDGRDYANRAAALGNSVVPEIPELIGRAILGSRGMITDAAA